LAPFRFQEHLDFILDDGHFADVTTLLKQMREADQARQLGSASILRGLLLQLIGKICNLFEPQECWNYLKAAGYASV